ncbi:MAG TPA: hypothetical protein VM640_01575 [Desulfitobacterium sp.]|nr:hypothetical protein [Desulfitobacterium sp.]
MEFMVIFIVFLYKITPQNLDKMQKEIESRKAEATAGQAQASAK